MNIVLDTDQFNINNVFFQNSVKNTIMDNCNFYRIIYSNDLFMLNGIFLKINLNIKYADKYFNKYKCNFSYDDNKSIIDAISEIETFILCMINISKKVAIYSIREQFTNETIKFFTNIDIKNEKMKNEFILKISGIWESEKEYGITYKFLTMN